DDSSENNIYAPNNTSANGYYGNNTTPGNGSPNNVSGNNNVFVPELEEDFEFSQPAVVGDEVYIANETLNSAAIISSTSLAIKTVPVGFRPTEIVGPAGASSDDARVMVLNEGSDSVSVIDPRTREVSDLPVMPGANRLRSNAAGTAAIAYYDADAAETGDQIGDLSSVTLLREGSSLQIAVGFNVQRVQWSEDDARALVLSDDGVSILDVSEIDSDRVVPPVAVLPQDLIPLNPSDLEVQIDREGKWAIARLATFSGIVLTNLANSAQAVVHLPEIPTDIDLAQAENLEVLVMMRNTGALMRATIPEGVLAAAAATKPPEEPTPSEDMGTSASDMGLLDMDQEDMAPADMGPMLGDMSDMAGMEDMPAFDMADMDASDMGADMPIEVDMGVDLGIDMGADMSVDMAVAQEEMGMGASDMGQEPSPGFELDVPGVEIVQLDRELKLGAAAVSGTGTQALIYTTLDEQRRALLLDLRDGDQRPLRFEKGLKAVIPDDLGATFIVFHTRVAGEPPVDQSPSDPVFIARSWGLSVVDVATASPRLVLTEHEPWVATRWSVDDQDPRVFVIFKRPIDETFQLDSHRDVLGINLFTFGVDSFRVPSLPEGIGAIPSGRRVYINQKHPQGRMTFVDVVDGKRQTVTGYQLNSGID
ncbi:MAG: hypothetical protein VX475_13190, partial [Myxococcota bacterium]|nr:hypothetical protein [Myxococcota bacterium]